MASWHAGSFLNISKRSFNGLYIFHMGVSLWGVKNKKVETLTQGKMSMVVKDGILNLAELGKIRIPKEELFAMLRELNIDNLGSLERVYLEPCGILSKR